LPATAALGLALALMLMLAPLRALALDLPELMNLLAQRPSGVAKFTEERFVQGLDQPLKSSGELSFSAPDKFARRTTAPKAESMTVEGSLVTLERGGRQRQFVLDNMPEMAAIVTAVRGTLTGNAQNLRESFVTEVLGSPADWTLSLTPRDERLLAVIKRMRIGGQRAEMRRVEVQLADGDRSVMSIEPQQAQASTADGAKPRNATQ
jgi:outer membrane lipoprotein-sorting protein